MKVPASPASRASASASRPMAAGFPGDLAEAARGLDLGSHRVSLRRSYSRRAVSVSRLCRAGRQCMNFTAGFPVAAITSRFTW